MTGRFFMYDKENKSLKIKKQKFLYKQGKIPKNISSFILIHYGI